MGDEGNEGNVAKAKARVIDLPAAKSVKPIKPKVELAIRMYACGQVESQKAAAVIAGIHPNRFNIVLNSPQGEAIVRSVRGELEFQYRAMYKRFIEVVGAAMKHPDPAVALAGAGLYAKTSVGTKHTVVLTAEDVVQQIISGEYVEDK